jgi:hypothetical protein
MREWAAGILLAAFAAAAHAGPYSESGRAIVRIHVYGTFRQPENNVLDYEDRATGFIVSPDGLVLTAGHVAPDATQFRPGQLWIEAEMSKLQDQIMVTDGHPLPLEVVKAETSPHDVALMRIKNPPGILPFVRLCDQYSMDDTLTVLGYTGGLSTLSRTLGTVKTPAYQQSPLVMQMPLSGGDSGGPVFNSHGAVFGIAIGQEMANLQRLNSTNLAEIMPAAMIELAPNSDKLKGVSYDPDCAKALPPIQVALPFQEQKTSYVTLAANGQGASIVQRFTPPEGYRFSGILSTGAQALNTLARANVGVAAFSPNGNWIDLPVNANSTIPIDSFTHLTVPIRTSLAARLQLAAAPILPNNSPEPQVRTFTISRTQDTHSSLKPTRTNYHDRIPAPRGYTFAQVLSVTTQNLNHSPSGGLKVMVASQGSVLQVDYELESGPIWDRWRGWIDAIIVVKLDVRKHQ